MAVADNTAQDCQVSGLFWSQAAKRAVAPGLPGPSCLSRALERMQLRANAQPRSSAASGDEFVIFHLTDILSALLRDCM